MPATQIPLTFRIAPLPKPYKGTPQQLATDIVARLSAVSANTISFFASGSVAPTSNVGPWLKNDQTWYVWSDALATYIPEVIEPQSLGYVFSQVAPDPTVFKIWYKLDASNNPLGIFLYTNGSWQDAYGSQIAAINANLAANYLTATQTNAAIAAAVSSQTRYAFSATKSVDQVVTAGAGETQLTFETEQYDIDGRFASNKYVAAVGGIYSFRAGMLTGANTGTPTNISITFSLMVNGASVAQDINESDVETSGQNYLVARDVALAANDEVTVSVIITTTGASTWGVSSDSRLTFFQGSLIQAV